MAVPVVESGFTKAGGEPAAGKVSVSEPSGLSIGDLCIIVAANDNTSSTAQYDDSTRKPTGFTFINHAGDTNSDCHVGAFWRVIDGTESWPIEIDSASSNSDDTAFAIRVTGANTSDPIDVVGADCIETSSSSIDVTGVTTTEDDCLVFYVVSADGGDMYPFSVSGTGWTESDEVQSVDTDSSANASCWGTKDQASTGASGTATVSASTTDGLAGFQFAIKPAAATGHEGSAALVFSGLMMAATGKHAHEGSAALVFSGLMMAATGEHAHEGSVALVFTPLAVSAIGEQVHEGSAALDLAALAMAATGEQTHEGSAAITIGTIAIEATGEHPHEGSVALAFTPLAISATGEHAHESSAALTIGSLAIAATGEHPHEGSAAVTVGTITIAATGVHSDGHTGSADLTVGTVTIAAAGEHAHEATAILDFGGVILSASATVPFDANAQSVISNLISELISNPITIPMSGTSGINLTYR